MAGFARLQSVLLLAGAGLWVLAEGFGLFSGGIAGWMTRLGSIAFVLIALGATVLWSDRDADALSRAGVVLASAGLAVLALMLHLAVDSPARRASDLAGEPLFVVGSALAGAGALLVIIWMARKLPYGLLPVVWLIVAVCAALAGAFLAWPPIVQTVADIAVAVMLAEIAVQAMGRAA